MDKKKWKFRNKIKKKYALEENKLYTYFKGKE